MSDDDQPLPTDLLSYTDRQFGELVEHLSECGLVKDDEVVTSMTIEVTAEESVVVKDIETEEVMVDGS